MSDFLSKNIKLLILIGTIVLIGGIQLVSKMVTRNFKALHNSSCIYDNWKIPLFSLIDYMTKHDGLRKGIIIVNSLLIDLAMLIYSFIILLKGNCVLPISAGIFYLTRSLSLNLGGEWPEPSPFLFTHPGFPSIFVSYKKANDCYFSGHIGLTTMLLLVSIHSKRKFMTIYMAITVFFTAFMLILTGAHFSNDVIIGAIYAVLACVWTFEVKDFCVFYLQLFACKTLSSLNGFIKKRLNKKRDQQNNASHAGITV